MPLLRPNTPPPPDYYANNLQRVFSGVARQYSDLLRPDEAAIVERVLGLSQFGLRLYARVLSRNGPAIRIDRLRYAEIPDIAHALNELRAAELVRFNADLPADLLLSRLTLFELHRAFPYASALRKPVLVDHLSTRYTDLEIRRRIALISPWLTIAEPHVIAMVCVLFFGSDEHDLTTFVLEDLGVWRFESVSGPQIRPFARRADLDLYLAIGALRDHVPTRREQWNIAHAARLVEQLWVREADRIVERRRTRLLDRVGAAAERAHDADTALMAYARSDTAFARERAVRVLARLGDACGVHRRLSRMREAPRSLAEGDFAKRFLPGRLRVRAHPHAAPTSTLVLDAQPEHSVERAALSALLARNGVGAHLENRFPLALFGLAFWDVVFAPIRGAFSNAYQRGPIDLFWADFGAARADLIAGRLKQLDSHDQLRTHVQETWCTKRDISNALVSWDALQLDLVMRAIDWLPIAAWHALFTHLSNNLGEARTGFPDLAVFYDDGAHEFVEVKGPGDQLKNDQRNWLAVLARAGLCARVLKVSW